MLLQSMLFSLVRDYSPGQLQFYVLDYSSGMLRLFQKLPHCAAVLTEDDNAALDVFSTQFANWSLRESAYLPNLKWTALRRRVLFGNCR